MMPQCWDYECITSLLEHSNDKECQCVRRVSSLLLHCLIVNGSSNNESGESLVICLVVVVGIEGARGWCAVL